MSDPEIIVAAATPDDSAARKGLKDQGFPEGMIDNMIESKKKFPLRIWVVDNSGSMRVNDGQRIVENSAADDLKFAQCTRWAELEQCVDYHIDLAGALEASSIFRLLNSPEQNNPPQFSIANNEHESIEEDIVHAKEVMKSSKPDEYTPLVRHVIEICEYVKTMEADLRRAGQKVAVILATDGVPSDGHKDKFLHHLKQLTALPVWLVIRLCTNEDNVVDYFSDFDKYLERPVEVLDDFRNEAREVHKHNPWINYGIPLHRAREFGFKHRLFDLIDERRLTIDELLEYCILLFGKNALKDCPNPNVDWEAFKALVTKLVASESKPWNPFWRKSQPWIDISQLMFQYEDPLGCYCAIT